jgi:phage gpG-like protein
MKLEVDVDLEGMEILLAKLKQSELRRALKPAGEGLVNIVQNNVKASRDPYGQAWKPLAESTLNSQVRKGRRRRQYQGGKPLIRTLNMLRSLNSQVTESGLEVGFAAPYAKYHNGDTGIVGKGKVPQRRMLPTDPSQGLPKAWRNVLTSSIEGYLEE